jgi:uncharacterized protein (TIGR03437 family)
MMHRWVTSIIGPGIAILAAITFTIFSPLPVFAATMSGTLTLASSSCIILAGGSTCTVGLTWTTTNPVSTSAVTSNYQGTVATGNNSSAQGTVPYVGTTFYLYNNAVLLAQKTATASCASGTTWNQSTCHSNAVNPTGTLTLSASSCTIQAGGSSCNVNATWSTTNPGAGSTSAITADGQTWASGNSGGPTALPVPYGSRTFYLYNSSALLDQKTATASCTSGTTWNQSTCQSASGSGTISASPNPCTVAVAGATCILTLAWSTASVTAARVYVVDAGGADQQLYTTTSGSQSLNWIQALPQHYTFNLWNYSTGSRGTLLSSVNVSVAAPVGPSISAIQPQQPIAGNAVQTLTVIGQGFRAGSVVLITPPELSTQSVQAGAVSGTQLSVSTVIGSTGTWTFQVRNPDSGLSNSYTALVADGSHNRGTIVINSNLSVASFRISPQIPGAPTSGPFPVRFLADAADYTVEFQSVAGYKVPSSQTSTLRPGDNVTFTGNYESASAPALSSDLNSLPFSYSASGVGTLHNKSINIRSSGKAIDFSVAVVMDSGSGWLTANVQSATTPRTITVAVSGNLSPGTYTGSLRLTTSDPAISPLNVPVSLSVTKTAPKVSLDFIDPSTDTWLLSQTIFSITKADQKLLDATTGSPPVKGLSADGVSRVILRFKATEAGTLTLDLVGDSKSPSDKRLSLSQPQYGELIGSTIRTQLLGGSQYAFSVLRAPPVWKPDSINVQYTFKANSDGSTSTGVQNVLVLRPPVILVHGIWDDPNGWKNWKDFYGNPDDDGCPKLPLADSEPFVCRIDYSGFSSASLITIAPIINRQINSQILSFSRKREVAAVQADIIAHSLGGLAVRTLPQCGGTFPDCSIAYRTSSNYLEGNVHRLVSIATPHLGTHIADILANNRDNKCIVGNSLDDLFKKLRKPIGGAFDDMVYQGDRIRRIQNGTVPFPVHFFAGIASTHDHTAFRTTTSVGAAAAGGVDLAAADEEGLLGLLFAWRDIGDCAKLALSLSEFQNENSDLLVPVDSALNGLPPDSPVAERSTLKYGNMIHSPAIFLNSAFLDKYAFKYSEPERDDHKLAQDLLAVLLADDNDHRFWKPTDASALPIGIAAVSPSITSSLRSQQSPASAGISSTQAVSVFSIKSPVENAIVPPGFSLPLTLEAVPGESFSSVDVISPAGWFHYGDPSRGIVIPLPADRQGPYAITVIATMKSGLKGSQDRQVSIEASAAATALSVTPGALHIYTADTAQHGEPSRGVLRVTATFPDGNRDITSSSLVLFRSENSSVVTVDAAGDVTAVAPGQTAIISSYGAISTSTLVQVNMSGIRGDVNGDALVDGLDYAALLQAIGQRATGPDDPRDLNADGLIDSKDISVLSSICASTLCKGPTARLAIVNAATFDRPDVAPGELVSLFGDGISNTTALAATVPLPTSVEGIEALFSGVPAPLFYVGSGQINAQVPFGLSPGPTTLTVRVFGIPVLSQSINIVPTAPGLFSVGTRTILQNADYTLNTSSNGAAAESYVVVYFTGQGDVDTRVEAGAAAPSQPLARTLAKTEATVGGLQCVVIYSGLTPGFAGLAQANIQVPKLPAGDYPFVLTVGGVSSNVGAITVR